MSDSPCSSVATSTLPNLSLRGTNPFSTASNPPAIDLIFGHDSGTGVTSEAAPQILLAARQEILLASTTSNNDNHLRYLTRPPRTQSKLRIKLTTVNVRIQWYTERRWMGEVVGERKILEGGD